MNEQIEGFLFTNFRKSIFVFAQKVMGLISFQVSYHAVPKERMIQKTIENKGDSSICTLFYPNGWCFDIAVFQI